MPRQALLISPPVYDTQYFARWSQPHGLLKIGSLLLERGYEVKLIDCLFPNEQMRVPKSIKSIVHVCSDDEQVAPKARKLAPGEKYKYCFGLPLKRLEQLLGKRLCRTLFTNDDFIPDEIWITSIMTYWWESTVDVVNLCKRVFPHASIKIGGIYPTLCSRHLQQKLSSFQFAVIPGKEFDCSLHSAVDCIVVGEIPAAIDQDMALNLYSQEGALEEELYKNKPKYCILTTSRGCPFSCAYCAQKALNTERKGRDIWGRQVDRTYEEMCEKRTMGITEFCFYEDNLLAGGDNFKALLDRIIIDRDKGGLLKDVHLNAPEGVEVRLLVKDPELPYMMKKAGFERIYLPLESVDPDINKRWNRAHARLKDFEKAVALCEEAGFKLRDLEVNAFILFGLPGENIQKVVDTVLYASQHVGAIVPMLFTPVPGTQIYAEYQYLFEAYGFDLQHLNGKLYPFLKLNQELSGVQIQDYYDLESFMFRLNQKAKGGTFDMLADNGVAKTFRHGLQQKT